MGVIFSFFVGVKGSVVMWCPCIAGHGESKEGEGNGDAGGEVASGDDGGVDRFAGVHWSSGGFCAR